MNTDQVNAFREQVSNAHLRAQIVAALRYAADALESGAEPAQGLLRYVTMDGVVEIFDDPAKCYLFTKHRIEPDGDEFDDSIRNISWGAYVAVERVHVNESERDDLGRTPEELGKSHLANWWDVSLNFAWPDAE